MMMPSVRSAGAKSAPEGVACHRSAYVAEMWTPGSPSCRIECVSCTRFGMSIICKRRVWPAADGSCPAGAARHDPLPLARLSHRSIAGLALHRLVDARELDGPDWGWPGASKSAEPVPGQSPGGIYLRGWSQARIGWLRCGRVRPAVGRPPRRGAACVIGRQGGGLARSGSWLSQLVCPWLIARLSAVLGGRDEPAKPLDFPWGTAWFGVERLSRSPVLGA